MEEAQVGLALGGACQGAGEVRGRSALADAATIWAAHAACLCADGLIDVPHDARRRQEPLARARSKLGYERAQAAERRGAAMSLATAAEYELLLAAGDPATPQSPPELSQLSPREHELVTLVAPGGTNAQIAHPAVHRHPHRRLAPGPDPGQDRLPALH